MNYRTLTIIALIFMVACIPLASAEWMNGVWYTSDQYGNLIAGDTATHNPVSGVDSKYNPHVGSVYDKTQDPNTYSGWVEVRIRSGSSVMNPEITLINQAMPGVNKTIDVSPNGITDITGLPAGTFTIILHRFDLPDEIQTFTIATGQQTPSYVVFLGEAFSSGPEAVVSSGPVSTCRDLDVTYSFYGGNFGKGIGWNLLNLVFHHSQYKIVTGTVRGLVSNDFLHISADYSSQHYNSLFTDPNYGTVKGLYVLYTCKETKTEGRGENQHTFTLEVPHTAWVSEQQDLNIPTI